MLINLCGGICKGIPKVGKNVIFKYPPHKGIKFGKKCDIGAFSHFDIPPFGKLIVGDCVKMTQGVVVSAINKVEIQSNTLIAEWVSIRDAQHLFDKNEPINKQGMREEKSEILIEEDVWIGRGRPADIYRQRAHGAAFFSAALYHSQICSRRVIAEPTVTAHAPLRIASLPAPACCSALPQSPDSPPRAGRGPARDPAPAAFPRRCSPTAWYQ